MDGYHAHAKGGEFVTYERLRAMSTNGVQEPATGFENGKLVGTQRLYTDGVFSTEDGKARFMDAPWRGFEAPGKEQESKKFAFLINNGRANHVWQSAYLDQQKDFVVDRWPYPFIQMNPDDMKDLGLSAGDLVEVYNDNGATQAMAYPTATARRKQTFMLFAYPMGVQGNVVSPGVNELIIPELQTDLGQTFARSPLHPAPRAAQASSPGSTRSDGRRARTATRPSAVGASSGNHQFRCGLAASPRADPRKPVSATEPGESGHGRGRGGAPGPAGRRAGRDRRNRAGRGGRAAIAELGAGRVAERPAAHRLLELDDGHLERHRHDDALEFLLALDLRQRLRSDRERGRSAHHPGGRGAEVRRDAMRGLRRRAARPRSARARRLGPASEAQPMDLSNHRVAGHAVAKQTRDLARALAVNPMLLELLDYLVRPSHGRLVGQCSPKASLARNQTPSPGGKPAGQ